MNPSDEESSNSRKSQGVGWIANLTLVISLAPVLLFLASQLGRYSFACELLSNFQLFVLFSLLPFPFLLYVFGKRRWATFVGVFTLWSFWLVASVYVPTFGPPPGDGPPPGEQVVRVMSYNVLGKNPNHAAVLNVVQKTDPDVLLIVEYSRPWRTPFSILHDQYPYRVEAPRLHGFGIALFSKFPIKSESVLQLARTQSDCPAIDATLLVGDQTLRIVGLHAVSPMNSERMAIRNQQFSDMANHLQLNEEPTILMGDFNCTTWSPFLGDLMRATRLSDSRQGFGYQASWNASRWPLQIPIDHFLVSKHIHVHQRRVGHESGGSDHFPIVCEISIRPENRWQIVRWNAIDLTPPIWGWNVEGVVRDGPSSGPRPYRRPRP